MMGQLPPDQNALFYDFCLGNYVPHNHLLRQIDPFLDLSDLRDHLSSYYSPIGRPSVDPELMIRMLIVGYCYGIRSERRLCEEVHFNLAYRWFCRLGLEGKVPDHSTFSENRHGRFRESDTFRHLFETVLQRCMAEGLVGGEGFAVDASLVKADASRQRHREDDDDWGNGRAVREYLEGIDKDDTQTGKSTRKVSPTDPAASYTAAPGGPAFYAYSTNYLADTDSRYRRKFKNKRTGITKDNTIIYSSSKYDCDVCEHKPRCCRKVPQRRIRRSIYESSRDVARAVAQTPAYKKTRPQRKKVEMLFAHMKRILKLDRLRLRGMSGAHDEFLLAATTQNLRRMAKLLSQPPPDHRIGAPA